MLTVEVVSPETVSYTGEAELVVARTVGGGDVGFQPGHARFIGTLAVWSVDIVRADGTRDTFAVHRGFVQVSDDTVTILSDVSEERSTIDVPRAEAARGRAQEVLRTDPDHESAAAALARAELRLQVAALHSSG